ncbi:hypothetical protein GCM10023115_41830 [Pontixanthobacter gangjinensis]
MQEAGVKLKWSILNTTDFQSYEILRSESEEENNFQTLKFINDNEKTDFIDTELPYSPYVSYKIIGHNYSGTAPIESNMQVYKRPEVIKFNGYIDQVIPQFAQNKMYLISRKGQVTLMDLETNNILKTLETESHIGFVDIKTFNGKEELYVPRNDGWIYIYDAKSFELIDRIDTGRASSSIIFNNNRLFVSTDAWTDRPLKVYSRISGDLIEETGDFDLTRLRQIPGSNTDLLEITLNVGPVDQDIYKFDANGSLIEHLNDTYHGDFSLDANIFNFFPDAERFITGREGAIYSKNMIYQSRLPKGYLEFSSFSFNIEDQLIYAGCSNERSIQEYDLNDLSRKGFIETKSYPQFIFKNLGQIYIIGLSSNSNNSNFVFEKINL